MPFIDVSLKDAKEGEVVPEGEYDLRIVKTVDKDSKAGNPMTQCTIRIESKDYPNAMPINHFLTYPTDKTPEDQKAMRLRDIMRFLQLFEIAHEGNGFDTDDLNGATATCFVTQEPGDDGQVFNRLRLPRLVEEEEVEEVDTRKRRANRRR